MRQSTELKRDLQQQGVKVLRVKIDPYRNDLLRVTVPVGTPSLADEVRREPAKVGVFLVPSTTMQWVWFKR